MRRLFFLLPILFFIKVSAQEPYFDFKKFRENNISNDSLKNISGKTQRLGNIMGKITFSNPNGTFILPLDKNISNDSLENYIRQIQLLQSQATAKLLFIQPNGTRTYALPQDNMPCLVPEMAQFNMPIVGKVTKITGMPLGSAPPNNIIPEK